MMYEYGTAGSTAVLFYAAEDRDLLKASLHAFDEEDALAFEEEELTEEIEQ